MKIQKFKNFNENTTQKAFPSIHDLGKLHSEIEIVDYLYRCNLMDKNFELFQEEGLDWNDIESLGIWGLFEPEYGNIIDLPNDINIPELVKKVKALTETYTNLGNYMKKLNN